IMNIYKAWLKQHGINFNDLPFGLLFQHQGGNFLIADNSGDTQFFQLLMPKIHNGNDSERNRLIELCNKINEDKKVVKAHVTDENEVWISTEILIDNTPDVDDFFDRLLQMLHQARMDFLMKYHQY
ncbi:MAG: YbjN domain-containing protein, partial [Paramuribaculum sp.]|nr:YbjN domain-containing protein [Paramuribaculum sp.]